jgi:sec-independent protein translocase protein TatA
MMSEHWPLLLIVLALAVVFLGPKRLPEAGRGLGQAIRGFRDETKGMRDELAPIKADVMGLKNEVTDARDSVHSAVKETITGSTPAS